ncbi:hypothetical protein SAMN04490243_1881 [Robiginitalea myxolifaciens]|uniref:Uncharacterized protein n=1 Tax=Robiginitalea myxolifaciens TaxID=400055 RepID=A0A1I6GYE9_9FLAO|nr:hypothetical protein SAMN04490243_1881 [Robiginitalea myxolifaciens]
MEKLTHFAQNSHEILCEIITNTSENMLNITKTDFFTPFVYISDKQWFILFWDDFSFLIIV